MNTTQRIEIELNDKVTPAKVLAAFALLGADVNDFDDIGILDISRTDWDGSGSGRFIDVAGMEWDLPAYALAFGERWLVWTRSDGAGVDDVALLDMFDDQAADEVAQDYADKIASEL